MLPIRNLPIRLFFLIACCVLLPACAVPSFHDMGTPPPMSAVSTSEPMQQSLIEPEPIVIKASHRVEMEDNGIWNRQDAIYFRDTRAYKIGDILTVRIFINDSARLNNRSDADVGATGSLGFDFSGSLMDHDLSSSELGGNLDATSELTKGGTVNRAERIQLRIAASIIDASPNGNLLIRGSQEVRVNHQMRVLTVTGIVRAKDILPDNSIPYEKIAEARISYGGNNTRYATERPRSFLARLTRAQ